MLKINKKTLTVTRVALFECKIEESPLTQSKIKSAELIREVINFEKLDKKYESLLSVLELNIKRKLMSNESPDLSKKKSLISVADCLFDDVSKRGRPIVSMILKLKDPKDNILDQILESETDDDFKSKTKKLANDYCLLKKDPIGIIGFAQFQFKISGRYETFLAILTTNFSRTIVSPDIERALIYLQKAFDHNFKTTILYPHLVPFDNRKRTDKEAITIDRSNAKVDIKKMDPEIFAVANISEPVNPQLMFEKLYSEKRLGLKNIKEITKYMEPEDLEKVFVCLEVSPEKGEEIKLKISLKSFLDKVDLIYSKGGKGVFFRDSDIKVLIKNRDIFSDQKIRFKEVSFKD